MASIKMKHKHSIKFCNKKHRQQIIYDEQYDSYFCPRCEKWIEDKCGDNDCEFCSNRPDKAPGQAIFEFNNGSGTILCSKCNIIIKEESEFTDLETEFVKGTIFYVPEYFCEKCNNN